MPRVHRDSFRRLALSQEVPPSVRIAWQLSSSNDRCTEVFCQLVFTPPTAVRERKISMWGHPTPRKGTDVPLTPAWTPRT